LRFVATLSPARQNVTAHQETISAEISMKSLIKWSALILLLVSQTNSALARGHITFNGQAYVDTDKLEAGPAYGQYRPSEFSAEHHVVLVSWNSEEGKKRLFRSQYNSDFFQLAHHYQPQANPLYCGIASSVIVLNAIRTTAGTIPNQPSLSVMKPKEFGGGIIPYPLYSQASLLNDNTDKVKAREIIQLKSFSLDGNNDIGRLDPGLKLAELQGTLESYQLSVAKYPADADIEIGAEEFREIIRSALADAQHFILLNNHPLKRVGLSCGLKVRIRVA